MYVLMRDPVTLPSSKIVVDRSTIKTHLLSDACDPFNRVPLKPSEYFSLRLSFPIPTWRVSDPEVKAKIDAFLLERRSRGKAGVGNARSGRYACRSGRPRLHLIRCCIFVRMSKCKIWFTNI